MIGELPGREPLAASAQGGTIRLSAPPSRIRLWLSEHQGRLGLAGLLATGLVVSLSAGNTDILLPQSVRGGLSVTGLGGVLGSHGIDLHAGGVALVLALMFVSYALAVRAVGQLSARAVVIGIAALHALVLLAPPLLSTDVFSYIAYGRIGAHSNPYLHGPSAIRLDLPLYSYIGAQWVNTPSDYGPLFTGISYLLVPLSIAGNVIAYKAIAAGSSLVVVWVVWNAARLRGIDQVKAVTLVGLNPVIVVFGVGGGHNDMLMLAILMASVYVLLLRRERTGGALIVAAAAVKLTGGLLLPFAVAEGSRRGPDGRGSRKVLIGVGLAGLGAAGLSFGLFGLAPLHLLTTIQTVQSQGGLHSIPGLLLRMLGLAALGPAVGLVLDVVFVACLTWLVVRVWLGELDWITGAGWATVALLVTAGLLLPWYVGWLVPLAALSTDRRLLLATLVLTGVGLTTL